MDVHSLTGKTALVTGAASGIGRETALAFAERGADLVLCDVNEEGLGETERRAVALGRAVFARRVDVAREDEMRTFAGAVHERIEAVDILMNNAGLALGAGLLDTTLDDWDRLLGVNLRGVIYGCHFFVPPMVARRAGGHIVNVASAAGYFASEGLLAYCTTKFGVVGLSEALREELAPHDIGVTVVCPGLINTPIVRTSPMRGPGSAPEARQRIAELYERRNYGPERVARNVLKAIRRNRGVAPIAAEAWVFYYAKRFTPNLLRWLSRRVGERMRRRLGVQ